MTEIQDDIAFKILHFIESLAINFSEHLRTQHKQAVDDEPRFYIDNIVKQVQELKKEILGDTPK